MYVAMDILGLFEDVSRLRFADDPNAPFVVWMCRNCLRDPAQHVGEFLVLAEHDQGRPGVAPRDVPKELVNGCVQRLGPSPDLALGDEDVATVFAYQDVGLACGVERLAGCVSPRRRRSRIRECGLVCALPTCRGKPWDFSLSTSIDWRPSAACPRSPPPGRAGSGLNAPLGVSGTRTAGLFLRTTGTEIAVNGSSCLFSLIPSWPTSSSCSNRRAFL